MVFLVEDGEFGVFLVGLSEEGDTGVFFDVDDLSLDVFHFDSQFLDGLGVACLLGTDEGFSQSVELVV